MRRTLPIALAIALLLAVVPTAGAAELGSRLLQVGSRGDDVVQLQRAMRVLGYGVQADGIFGPKTARSVRRYERRRGMKVDGKVGARQARQILRAAARASSGGVPAGEAPAPDTGGQAPAPPSDDPPAPPSDDPPAPPSEDPPAPPSEDPPPAGGHVFPVAGTYSFGTAVNRFGAPRSGHTHQGQDILAASGTPVVSVSGGTVARRAYQDGGAGNYVVIRGSDGYDYVYMHLRSAAVVGEGDRVAAGQRIGDVGSTGASTAPHLHFEIWTAHWRDGGQPVDPLPSLQGWR
jgi:murein DD-endopeptidase MepM/ murein hydrolase activator NlpD